MKSCGKLFLSIAEVQKEPFLSIVSMHDLGKITSVLTEFGLHCNIVVSVREFIACKHKKKLWTSMQR